jgi:hypothetical protein
VEFGVLDNSGAAMVDDHGHAQGASRECTSA